VIIATAITMRTADAMVLPVMGSPPTSHPRKI